MLKKMSEVLGSSAIVILLWKMSATCAPKAISRMLLANSHCAWRRSDDSHSF